MKVVSFKAITPGLKVRSVLSLLLLLSPLSDPVIILVYS